MAIAAAAPFAASELVTLGTVVAAGAGASSPAVTKEEKKKCCLSRFLECCIPCLAAAGTAPKEQDTVDRSEAVYSTHNIVNINCCGAENRVYDDADVDVQATDYQLSSSLTTSSAAKKQ